MRRSSSSLRLSRGVTGEVIHVDGGFHVMGHVPLRLSRGSEESARAPGQLRRCVVPAGRPATSAGSGRDARHGAEAAAPPPPSVLGPAEPPPATVEGVATPPADPGEVRARAESYEQVRPTATSQRRGLVDLQPRRHANPGRQGWTSSR